MAAQTEILTALTEWMPHQRWFGGKGTTPALKLVGSFDLPADGDDGSDPSIDITTLLVLDEGGHQQKLYQVPLTIRRDPIAEGVPLVGRLESGRYVYDGAADPAYAKALITMITGGTNTSGAGGATASGRSQVPGHPLVVVSAQVLKGEQSNTSIIMTVTSESGEEQPPVICKVFRVLHPGENPDVVLQSALAAAGSTRVPASVGSVVGQWNDSQLPEEQSSGHLAFAQEFLPGVRDAWRVALEAADEARPFTAEAHALGTATAEVHETLSAVMPTVPPSPGLIAEVLASMQRRHAEAVREVPDVARFSPAIDAIVEKAAASQWPPLQRIHGDYHLGQVLAVPGGRWVLVDFEGEPLRPMEERNQPDLTLRDIAGMLRSFDYVAGSFAETHPGESAAAWATDARQAFLDGYSARSGYDLAAHRPLLDALEIDKALYETIYEARNRPSWLPIPLQAIARLVVAVA